MVVRFFPLAATHFAKARACSTVIGVSTRTASRSPEIRVDEIGGHGRCFSPGGNSLLMAGMLGDKNTSHVSDIFPAVRLALDVPVLDCPCLEWDSSALIGESRPITKAVPSASAKISRLEDIMALSDLISLSFFCYFSFHWSVNTTGAQLYPLPSLRKRPRGGKNDECGTAIKTSSLASLGSNCCRVAAAAVWSMSKIAVTSGWCNWTRCAWTMSPQNRIFCPFDENS